MSTPFPIPVTAAQVGTYFVAQYYPLLQKQPQFVHQFYSDASTMLRIDGTNRDSATTMLQIHALVMSLKYTGFEIRTAHSLESWNGGVLVMVSGSVAANDLTGRRKFVETFFLAPQEKGYFVLNDVFHFVDDEPVHHYPAALLAQKTPDSIINTPAVLDPVPNFLLSGEIRAMEFVAPADAEENCRPVDNYSLSEQQWQQSPESEKVQEENFTDSNGSLQNTRNAAENQLSASVEGPVGEPQKHTYASILRVTKGQYSPPVASQASLNKNAPLTSDRNDTSEPATLQTFEKTNLFESSGADTLEAIPVTEHEDEIRSVYVRNLTTTMSEIDIEEEFKKFGSTTPDGVVIRSRKDVGVCYAFVEFEDIIGVHNAVKAGTAYVAGRQVFIEERRPNSNIPSRAGRGRGRGRSSYLVDASRGRFGGRSVTRVSGGNDGGDRDYTRSRGNGYYRPSPRQDRGFSGYQVSRDGQNQSE